MRKLIISLLLLISSHNYAQYFGFGCKGGINFTRFADGAGMSNNGQSVHFGSVTYFGLQRNLGMQLEIDYMRQTGSFSFLTFPVRARVNYMSIPLLLKWKHSSGFFLNAGPQIDLKISQYLEDAAIPWDASEVQSSLVVGVGYRHESAFGIELRCGRSLTRQDVLAATGKPFGFSPIFFQVSLICLLLFDDN